MFNIPDNILEYFFTELKKKGKYNTTFVGMGAIIEPRKEQQYYKPNIFVKDLKELELALLEFVQALNIFYCKNNNLEDYHDLSFFFNNLLINMTATDAEDLTKFIYRRIAFFNNEQFAELDEPQILHEENGVAYCAQRVLESPGLETPYVLVFYMQLEDAYYNLPLIRYAFDEDGTCHLFAVQYGRDRVMEFDEQFKRIVNTVNTGITKYRNVSPSFVLSLSMFIELLQKEGVTKIVSPDFLCGRYRKYIGASSVKRSDMILERILNNYLRLLQRMEVQIEGLTIDAFPNEVDSFTHISLKPQNLSLALKQQTEISK